MSMKVNITNHLLSVGSMELVGVAAASMVQIGDTDTITLYSIFDTPPEAIIVGPFAPCRSRPPENRRRERFRAAAVRPFSRSSRQVSRSRLNQNLALPFRSETIISSTLMGRLRSSYDQI